MPSIPNWYQRGRYSGKRRTATKTVNVAGFATAGMRTQYPDGSAVTSRNAVSAKSNPLSGQVPRTIRLRCACAPATGKRPQEPKLAAPTPHNDVRAHRPESPIPPVCRQRKRMARDRLIHAGVCPRVLALLINRLGRCKRGVTECARKLHNNHRVTRLRTFANNGPPGNV